MRLSAKSLLLLLVAAIVIGSSCLGLVSAETTAETVVLYASEASVKAGGWESKTDSSAAGGSRIWKPDAGKPKVEVPLASPSSYFEMTFSAEAGTAYRLWIRGKAENNSPYNDSVHVQFSGSVNASGAPVFRIGTTGATTVNIEDDMGRGLSGWGWQDNGWGAGVMGTLVFFQSTGTQTIRVQNREDGLSIDQIVLSPTTYVSNSPGALKNDNVILGESGTPPPPPPPPTSADIVIWASDVPGSGIAGNWFKTIISSAADQTALRYPDSGGAKAGNAQASPSSYFEVSFNAQAGTGYRLWMRGRADGNSPYNDSVFAQFSGSVNASGSAVYRIGTTSSTIVNIEEDLGDGLSGWGWQDNGWGTNVLGPLIYFQSTGTQKIRVQSREDGLSIDQIVLSSQSYVNSSPGALRNDSVILPSTMGDTQPPENDPPTVSISATPVLGIAPLLVTFSSSASDPDGYITSYNWTFGDGHTSTVPFPINTYLSPGTFTARLTVTDNSGATSSATRTITVNPLLPPPDWNIAMGRGTDNVYNLDRTATYIANMNPHVVTLCEVQRYSGDDQAQRLADLLRQKTGATWYFYFAPKYSGTTEGNLILSRFPLSSTATRFLSYQRSVAKGTISVNGRTIHVFATHLDPDSASRRNTQINEIRSWVNGFGGTSIVAGDFNAWPGASEISGMTSWCYDAWPEAVGDGTATAYPDNPVHPVDTRTRRARIDYVFFNQSSVLRVTSAQVPDTRDLSRSPVITLGTLDDRGVRPSDHNMVVVTLQVN
jgi:endonuclease/exonuclease/phosphatase family metal-dependent hydrolase